MSSIPSRAVTGLSSLLLLINTPQALGCGQSAASLVELPFPVGSLWRVTGLNATNQMTGYVIAPGTAQARAFLCDGTGVAYSGTLGGGYAQGRAINGSGQVAGESSLAGEAVTDAFLWSGGNLTDLGNLGGSWSSPTAINDSGQVVGFSWTAGDAGMLGFLYANGATSSLGSFGGGQSYALDINKAGVVVGGAALASGDFHAFSYSGGMMTDLGTLGGNYSSAAAVNNAGAIVGESALPNGEIHGFVSSGGVMSDVGTLGGTASTCLRINDNGDIIGTATTAAGDTHAFFYSGGTMTDLGTLGGNYSAPAAFNSLGQVAGLSLTSQGVMHAFLWQKGNLVDLNSLLPANSGWELATGELINDAGRITGSAVHNGLNQGFVLDLGAANSAPVAFAGADQTVDCRSQVVLDGTASTDPDGDALAYEWSTGGYVLGTNATLAGWLPLGTNVVTLKVTDPCGSSSQASVVVTVSDTTAPVIQSVAASPNVLSPPDHKLILVTVSVTATDGCDPAPVSKILSITANEPTDPGDIRITGALTAVLAASRNPAGGGRAYVITVQTTDASGNSSASAVTVVVPKGSDQTGSPTATLGQKPKPGKP